MSLPAKGICSTQLPITKPSATGNTCVTPSPESTTRPVRSDGCKFVKDAWLLGPQI